MKISFRCHVIDSHADGLRLFGDLPKGEEHTDPLGVVGEQRVLFRLGVQVGLQSLDGFFHLSRRHTTLYK